MSQLFGPSEWRRRVAAIVNDLMKGGPGPVTIPGNTTSGSAIVAVSVPNVSRIEIGAGVTGPGIPALTTVHALDNTGAVTLSANATATAVSVSLVFTNPVSGGSPMLHLAQDPMTPGPDPAPSDFTEATFDTYAAAALSAYVGPYNDAFGNGEIDFLPEDWVLTATPTITNVIAGYWIDYLLPDGVTRVVAAWEVFANPKQMTQAGNAVVLSAPIALPGPPSATII